MNDDEEKVRKLFENVEFNNENEDLTIISEEKKQKKKLDNKVIIIGGIILFIAIILIVVLLTSGGRKNDENSESGNASQNENKEQSNNDNTVATDYDIYKDKESVLLLNNFIYYPKKEEITYLSGEDKTNVTKDFFIKLGKESIYETKLTSKGITINYFTGTSFKEVLKKDGTFLYVKDNNDKLLGVFDKDSKKMYLLNKDAFSTTTLEGKYDKSITNENTEIIVQDNYLVTNSNNKYGLYDLKNDKELIPVKYEFLKYLKDKKLVAIKDKKAGIIDINDKEITKFKYDFIESSGNYFLAGEDKLKVLDKDGKELGTEIDVKNLNNYSYFLCCGNINPFTAYTFGSNLLIKTGTKVEDTKYYYLKGDTLEKLDILTMNISGKYLVTLNSDDETVTIYNQKMEKVIDIKVDTYRGTSANVFLDVLLVLDYNKFYNMKTGESTKVDTYRRIYKEYEVIFKKDKDKETGTLTISKDGTVLGTLENLSFKDYLETSDNGIINTNEFIIYSADKVLAIKK